MKMQKCYHQRCPLCPRPPSDPQSGLAKLNSAACCPSNGPVPPLTSTHATPLPTMPSYPVSTCRNSVHPSKP